MPFLKSLSQSEMQTALFRIWTWVADSISYNYNRYTKHTSTLYRYLCIYAYILENILAS